MMLLTIRRRTARAALTLTVLAPLAAALAACNTMAGAGEDMSATGHAVTNSAEQNKPASPAPAEPDQPPAPGQQ